MSLPADTPLSADRAERRTSDPRADALEMLVLPLLHRQAGDLAARWSTQARSALSINGAEGQDAGQLSEAHGLVEALIGSDANGDGWENATGHALRFGTTAFARGVSVHHVLKSLDLLMAMTLFAMESVLDELDESQAMSATDGVRLSRRLHRRGTLLSLAATRGYMQAYADAVRDGFRRLRHDLRNPLGTIRSVLALMDDESVPLEARVNPNFRAMAARNARTLEELITDRLGDATALLPTVAGREVSVHAIVCAVRRELRAEADRRQVTISVEEGGPHGWLDAAGLELLLYEVLHAILQDCEPGEQLHVDFDRAPGHAAVTVSRESGCAPLRESVAARLSALARQIGATVTSGERLLVMIPLRTRDLSSSERERSVPRETGELSDREARHDVRGAREGHHGQTGAH